MTTTLDENDFKETVRVCENHVGLAKMKFYWQDPDDNILKAENPELKDLDEIIGAFSFFIVLSKYIIPERKQRILEKKKRIR